MKILYITDSHLKDKNPVCRKDDYPTAIIGKMRDAVNLANEHKAHLVHGGDLFDSPRISFALFYRLWSVLQSYWRKPMQIVVGNHEWKGSWDEWSGKSPLAILQLAGIAKLYPEELVWNADGFVIHSVHKHIVDKPVLWEHTLMSDYAGPGNIVLISDYHPQQGHIIKKLGKKKVHFISPGAMARGSRAETDITRTPCAALIDIEWPEIEVSFVPLPSALPAGDVYNERVEDTVAEKRQSFDEAVQHLKSLAKQIKVCSVLDVLEIVARRTNPSKEAKELCQSRLSR